jgi:hypothetical protein
MASANICEAFSGVRLDGGSGISALQNNNSRKVILPLHWQSQNQILK